MESTLEAVAISADVLFLAYFIKSYLNSKGSLKRLEDVRQLNVGPQLIEAVKEANGNIPYVSLRGNVEALSPPIHSFNTPSVTGVVQRVTVKEHVVSQSRAGFWVDHKRPINTIVNSVPFVVRSLECDTKVEVLDALAADVLDMEVVADRFDPAPSTFLQTLWQFATGYRKQGVHTKEELLKEGTLVTVVGEVVGKDECMVVGPPADGAPFFITTMPLRSLLRRVESDISYYKWLSIGVGVVTMVTCSWVIFRRWREWYTKEREKRKLQETRRERRQRVRNNQNLNEEQVCAVCQTNPKEIILLPCGHVCLCEDCSDLIPNTCPICQRNVESRNAAYIS